MALPRGAEAAMCPPFQCRQDEASLTLLLLVPGIQPQSLGGDVGTNHYSLRFATATAAYALFLQFPPQSRLVSPESSRSVSAHNAAIGLAKAPGSTGPWEKFSFGLDASSLQNHKILCRLDHRSASPKKNLAGFKDIHWDGGLKDLNCSIPKIRKCCTILKASSLEENIHALNTRPWSAKEWRCQLKVDYWQVTCIAQERLFVSEENVDGFLDTVLRPSFCSQSAPERQPLIEVVDVTEDRIQINLKPQEEVPSERDGEEGTLSSSGGDPTEKPSGDCPQTKAETNCTPADTAERATETSKTSPSFPTAETIGKVGCSSHHCSPREPSDTSSAVPGGLRRKEPDLESAGTAGEAGSDKQAGLGPEGQEGDGDGDAAAAPAGSAQGNQHGSGRAASPLLREVNADGSVQVLRDHVTCCPFPFQNTCLYDLD